MLDKEHRRRRAPLCTPLPFQNAKTQPCDAVALRSAARFVRPNSQLGLLDEQVHALGNLRCTSLTQHAANSMSTPDKAQSGGHADSCSRKFAPRMAARQSHCGFPCDLHLQLCSCNRQSVTQNGVVGNGGEALEVNWLWLQLAALLVAHVRNPCPNRRGGRTGRGLDWQALCRCRPAWQQVRRGTPARPRWWQLCCRLDRREEREELGVARSAHLFAR